MKQTIRIILLIGFLALVGWTVWYLYQKDKEAPVVFDTEMPEVRTIIKKTVATGAINPRKVIDIKPRVSGIIDELYVEEGDTVKKGDIIARIKIIPNMVSLNNAQTRLNNAKNALETAKESYNRNKKLYDQKVIAKAEFDAIELNYLNAQEEIKAAQNNLELVQEGVSRSMGTASNTNVVATAGGMVLTVPVEIGNSVIESNTFNDGTTIATVANMRDLIFEGKVDESEVGKIKEGMDLIITVAAINNQRYEAILDKISPQGVLVDGAIQFDMEATVKMEPGSFIRAGYSANADIVLDRRDSVLAINEGLIQFDKDKNPYVEVATGEQVFERRDIKLGLSDGLYVEVLEGITKDDKIKKWNQYGGMGEGKPGKH